MLDKTSEKILKHLIREYYNTPDKDDKEILLYPKDFGLSVDEMNLLCSNLCKERYIDYRRAYLDEPVEAYITHKGLHHFEIKQKNFFRFWLPVIISSILAIIAIVFSLID